MLAVMVIAESCATRKKAISDEELSNPVSGTWINTEVGFYKPKVVWYDGRYEQYTAIENETPYCYGDIEVLEKWMDSNGDIFLENRWECEYHRNMGYELLRISDSGNTLERLYTKGEKRIVEWDPGNLHYTYKIYYRQE
jgi:hypothetical protein